MRYGTTRRPTPDTKRCRICGQVKPLTDYHRSAHRADGREYRCKVCENQRRQLRPRRDPRKFADRSPKQQFMGGLSHHLRKLITYEEYQALLEQQGGVCALCGGVNPRVRLVVDHCHRTNRVRGLLCTGCNVALGRLGDSFEALEKVLAYLKG